MSKKHRKSKPDQTQFIKHSGLRITNHKAIIGTVVGIVIAGGIYYITNDTPINKDANPANNYSISSPRINYGPLSTDKIAKLAVLKR